MHILSTRSYEAKEQLGDDEEELGVTFDLQNTHRLFAFPCSYHTSRKYFTYMYMNCAVLHFMSFTVLYLCSPAVTLSVLFLCFTL